MDIKPEVAMKKIYRLAGLAILLSLIACSAQDPLEKLIPASAMTGGIEKIEIKTTIQSGKTVKGGFFIEGFMVVPANIRRQQVRPTLLKSLKSMKQQHPLCEWFKIYLEPTEDFRESPAYAGIGEYKEGKIDLLFGIPTDAQILEWNDMIGKKVKGFGDDEFIVDHPPLSRPNDSSVRFGWEVVKTCRKIASKSKKSIDDKDKWPLAAKILKSDVNTVSRAHAVMYNYFDPYSWGEETIQ
jgi:hypothetical protein